MKKLEPISLDILMLRDRTYFENNPDIDRYIREYIPGELFPVSEGVTLFNEPEYVLVIKLIGYPGRRIRQPLYRKDLDEETRRRIDEAVK